MRVLLVDGFSEQDTIVAAADAALVGRDHEVTRLRLVDAGFDRFMSAAERRAYHQPKNLITPEQQESADLVRSHAGLLVCGPIVEGTIAPHIASWFERVFIPGVSFTFTKSGRVTGALRHIRRIGVIVASPVDDPWAHSRRGSTRSVIRSVRMSAALTCRTTYLALRPGEDVTGRVERVLSRW